MPRKKLTQDEAEASYQKRLEATRRRRQKDRAGQQAQQAQQVHAVSGIPSVRVIEVEAPNPPKIDSNGPLTLEESSHDERSEGTPAKQSLRNLPRPTSLSAIRSEVTATVPDICGLSDTRLHHGPHRTTEPRGAACAALDSEEVAVTIGLEGLTLLDNGRETALVNKGPTQAGNVTNPPEQPVKRDGSARRCDVAKHADRLGCEWVDGIAVPTGSEVHKELATTSIEGDELIARRREQHSDEREQRQEQVCRARLELPLFLPDMLSDGSDPPERSSDEPRLRVAVASSSHTPMMLMAMLSPRDRQHRSTSSNVKQTHTKASCETHFR